MKEGRSARKEWKNGWPRKEMRMRKGMGSNKDRKTVDEGENKGRLLKGKTVG